MEDYEKLLDSAVAKLPKKTDEGERFEIPRIDGFIQGNQTIIKNFSDICGTFRREPKYVLKYLAKALASPGSYINGRAIFQSKLSLRLLQEKLAAYVKEFVICPECGRPDTTLAKEGRTIIMRCQSCGARNSVH